MNGGVVEIELVILAFIYAGAGVAMVRAVLLRHAALRAWRSEAGVFDRGQHRFTTELDLDRARLPATAREKLMASRRVLSAGFGALLLAIVLSFFVLRSVA
jgi:hypothetical protein